MKSGTDRLRSDIQEASATEAPALLQQETVVTHGSDQDVTERRSVSGAGASVITDRTVVRDVAGARRRKATRIMQIVWFVVGTIEALLGLRFVLMALGANAEAGLTQLIFGITTPLVALFKGIFPNISMGGPVLETASVVAMVIYFLLGLGLAKLTLLFYGEPKDEVA